MWLIVAIWLHLFQCKMLHNSADIADVRKAGVRHKRLNIHLPAPNSYWTSSYVEHSIHAGIESKPTHASEPNIIIPWKMSRLPGIGRLHCEQFYTGAEFYSRVGLFTFLSA